MISGNREDVDVEWRLALERLIERSWLGTGLGDDVDECECGK